MEIAGTPPAAAVDSWRSKRLDSIEIGGFAGDATRSGVGCGCAAAGAVGAGLGAGAGGGVGLAVSADGVAAAAGGAAETGGAIFDGATDSARGSTSPTLR